MFLPAAGTNDTHNLSRYQLHYWTSSLYQDVVGEDIEGAWSTCEDYIHAQIVWLSYSGKHNLSRIGRNTAKSVRGVCVSPSTTVTTSGELKSYYTKAEADDRFALKNNVYTKTEIDALLGDMPLATVNITIEGGSDNVGTVKFLGQEWSVNKGVQTASFKVPAYSPVFLTILLQNEDNNHYYTLTLNNERLDSEQDYWGNYLNVYKNKVNGLIGPFPNSVNTLEIYLDNQAN